MCIGIVRVGSQNQKIVACSLNEMQSKSMGPPLHSLIIPGNLHPIEQEFLDEFKE